MNLKRVIRHLFTTRWTVSRAFPPRSLRAIEEAIATNHGAHTGQVRFAVEGDLDVSALVNDMSARERAIEVFSELRVWDTEHNNGVLIYLLLADRDVEIIADRGASVNVTAAEWEAICQSMEGDFRRGKFELGTTRGIELVIELLKTHFPAERTVGDELPKTPTVL